MAIFSENDTGRLDWELLRDGAVTLYWRDEVFNGDAKWLQDHGYVVHRIDCSEVSTLCRQFTEILRFKENFGYEPWTGNLNALNDAFRQLEFAEHAGIAFCFSRIDLMNCTDAETTEAVLDLIESHSRDYLLFGHRLIALAQSSDPSITFGPLGARFARWNRQEWFNASRG